MGCCCPNGFNFHFEMHPKPDPNRLSANTERQGSVVDREGETPRGLIVNDQNKNRLDGLKSNSENISPWPTVNPVNPKSNPYFPYVN
jgi:hypothetical protein